MNQNRIQELVKSYNLEKHPEGGYYSETYRGKIELRERSNLTSIYFLLDGQNVSHMHSIKSDELWYHHEGDALKIHMISPDGDYTFEVLGGNLENGEKQQVLVPANYIFGSEVLQADHGYGFVGCVVSPGFDFQDFKLYSKEELLQIVPDLVDLANRLT